MPSDIIGWGHFFVRKGVDMTWWVRYKEYMTQPLPYPEFFIAATIAVCLLVLGIAVQPQSSNYEQGTEEVAE